MLSHQYLWDLVDHGATHWSLVTDHSQTFPTLSVTGVDYSVRKRHN